MKRTLLPALVAGLCGCSGMVRNMNPTLRAVIFPSEAESYDMALFPDKKDGEKDSLDEMKLHGPKYSTLRAVANWPQKKGADAGWFYQGWDHPWIDPKTGLTFCDQVEWRDAPCAQRS